MSKTPRWVLDQGNKLARVLRTRAKAPVQNAKQDLSWLRWFFTSLVFVLGIVVIVVPLRYFYSIEINRFALDDSRPKTIVGESQNILIFSYEESNGYYFVNSMTVARVDPLGGIGRVVFIHPDLAVRTKYGYEKLRSVLAQFQLKQSEKILSSFIDQLEVLIGMQIDRYVALDAANFAGILSELPLNSYAAKHEVSDPDLGHVDVGTSLSPENLSLYLAADSAGLDARMLRQVDYVKQAFQDDRNPLLLAGLLYKLPGVSAQVETDMTRVELFNLINKVWRLTSIKTDYIKLFDTFYIETSTSDYYVPNLRIVDEKIKKLVASTEVQKEQARIEIYNAAGVNGLASKTQRLLQNLGANVVRAGNYPNRLDESVLYDPSGLYTQNVALIRAITRDEVEVLEEVFPFNHTGELILILGKDVAGE